MMEHLILKALGETLMMVSVSSIIGVCLGVCLGVVLFLASTPSLWGCPWVYYSLSFVVNAWRSIPYIIMIVLLIPFSRFIVGSSIGFHASIVPLSVAAVLLMVRFAEEAFRTVPKELMETGLAMGASRSQIVLSIVLREAWPRLVGGMFMMMVQLIGYSAMAGAVGGGGLGDLAIRYGYQRYDFSMLLIIVMILISLVQGIQMIGDALVRKLTR